MVWYLCIKAVMLRFESGIMCMMHAQYIVLRYKTQGGRKNCWNKKPLTLSSDKKIKIKRIGRKNEEKDEDLILTKLTSSRKLMFLIFDAVC